MAEKAGLMKSQRENDRAKTIWLVAAAALLLAPLYIFAYWKLGSQSASLLVLGVIPFLLLTAVIKRVSRSNAVTAHWVIALGYGLFAASSFYTGGIESPALTWSMVIPMLAVFLCGWRSGIVWFLLVLAKISVFYWAERAGFVFVQQYPTRENLKAAYYLSVLGIIGLSTLLTVLSEYYRARYLARLEEALANIKALGGLLPMCAWCKKVRNDKGYWDQVEGYLREHAEITVSHGICPECETRQMEAIKARAKSQAKPQNF